MYINGRSSVKITILTTKYHFFDIIIASSACQPEGLEESLACESQADYFTEIVPERLSYHE